MPVASAGAALPPRGAGTSRGLASWNALRSAGAAAKKAADSTPPANWGGPGGSRLRSVGEAVGFTSSPTGDPAGDLRLDGRGWAELGHGLKIIQPAPCPPWGDGERRA